jgi:hypothetical protein
MAGGHPESKKEELGIRKNKAEEEVELLGG